MLQRRKSKPLCALEIWEFEIHWQVYYEPFHQEISFSLLSDCINCLRAYSTSSVDFQIPLPLNKMFDMFSDAPSELKIGLLYFVVQTSRVTTGDGSGQRMKSGPSRRPNDISSRIQHYQAAIPHNSTQSRHYWIEFYSTIYWFELDIFCTQDISLVNLT